MFVFGMRVKVRMRVNNSCVRVPVGMYQVRSQQQLMVRQDLRRRAAGGNLSVFQDDDAIGDIFHNL